MEPDRRRYWGEVGVAAVVGALPFALPMLYSVALRGLPNASVLWRVMYAVRWMFGPGVIGYLLRVGDAGAMAVNMAIYALLWLVFRTRNERPRWQWQAAKMGVAVWLVIAVLMAVAGEAFMEV
jgi:hypothetical protein